MEQISLNLKVLRNKDLFYAEVLRIAGQFEAYLVDLNQIQLSQGRNISGEIIGTYAAATEAIAASQNTRRPKSAGTPYNFEWTGDLFDGMRIRVTSEYVEIFSTAPHAEILTETYGDVFGENSIFGLTEENLAEFVRTKLSPEVQNYVWNALNL